MNILSKYKEDLEKLFHDFRIFVAEDGYPAIRMGTESELADIAINFLSKKVEEESEKYKLLLIEATNPGINMEEVKIFRKHWIHSDRKVKNDGFLVECTKCPTSVFLEPIGEDRISLSPLEAGWEFPPPVCPACVKKSK